jgi:hypothetical protein
MCWLAHPNDPKNIGGASSGQSESCVRSDGRTQVGNRPVVSGVSDRRRGSNCNAGLACVARLCCAFVITDAVAPSSRAHVPACVAPYVMRLASI